MPTFPEFITKSSSITGNLGNCESSNSFHFLVCSRYSQNSKKQYIYNFYQDLLHKSTIKPMNRFGAVILLAKCSIYFLEVNQLHHYLLQKNINNNNINKLKETRIFSLSLFCFKFEITFHDLLIKMLTLDITLQ